MNTFLIDRVTITQLHPIYTKKDIKREFKAAGYGSIDAIVFEEDISCFQTGFQTAFIWFRHTDDEYVLMKRAELAQNLKTKWLNTMDVSCPKTPRVENNTSWILFENKRPYPNIVDDENPKSKKMRITELENNITRHQQIIYQLLGGLFNHTSQSNVLKDYTTYLFDGNHNKGPYSEDEYPTTRQGDALERKLAVIEERLKGVEMVPPSSSPSPPRQNDALERKLAVLEERLKGVEMVSPPRQNDALERKLAVLEDRLKGIEMVSPPRQNDTLERKLAALEQRLTAAGECLTKQIR